MTAVGLPGHLLAARGHRRAIAVWVLGLMLAAAPTQGLLLCGCWGFMWLPEAAKGLLLCGGWGFFWLPEVTEGLLLCGCQGPRKGHSCEAACRATCGCQTPQVEIGVWPLGRLVAFRGHKGLLLGGGPGFLWLPGFKKGLMLWLPEATKGSLL